MSETKSTRTHSGVQPPNRQERGPDPLAGEVVRAAYWAYVWGERECKGRFAGKVWGKQSAAGYRLRNALLAYGEPRA